MNEAQQAALRTLETGVPHILHIALQLEQVLIQQRAYMTAEEWQEVLEVWRAKVREEIAKDTEMDMPEVWSMLQSYLFPMIREASEQ